MNKKRILIIIITFLIFVSLILLMIINYKKTNDFELLGGLKENESCMTIVEPLVIKGKELCSFSCKLSNSYSIKFSDGREYKIKDALEKDLVTIEELKEKGLPCK